MSKRFHETILGRYQKFISDFNRFEQESALKIEDKGADLYKISTDVDTVLTSLWIDSKNQNDWSIIREAINEKSNLVTTEFLQDSGAYVMHIQYPDASLSISEVRNDGSIIKKKYNEIGDIEWEKAFDSNNLESWKYITKIFEKNEKNYIEKKQFDYGVSTEASWKGGEKIYEKRFWNGLLLEETTFSDGEKIKFTKYNHNEKVLWNMIEFFYINGTEREKIWIGDNGTVVKSISDSSGNLVNRTWNFFNGDVRSEAFQDNAIKSSIERDQSDSKLWSEKSLTYSSDGKIQLAKIKYDNGIENIEYFSPRGKTHEYEFDPNGISKTTFYSSSSKVNKIEKFDHSNSESWSERVEFYDALGDMAVMEIRFDSGLIATSRYNENGRYKKIEIEESGGKRGYFYSTDQGEKITASDFDDAVYGKMGSDTLLGAKGNDAIFDSEDFSPVGVGNDELFGGAGNDSIYSQWGNDLLVGGDGDDVLISGADSGEPIIARSPETKRYLPDQDLLLSSDTLEGGSGADTFIFKVGMNGTEETIRKNTMPSGVIHWHGVAQENNRLHDHWAEGFGDDVISDFNKGEGDKIRVLGHTAILDKIEYIDTEDDGQVDYSIVRIIANQGGAYGAHQGDILGNITVFGDIVLIDDVEVKSSPHYGAASTLDQWLELYG